MIMILHRFMQRSNDTYSCPLINERANVVQARLRLLRTTDRKSNKAVRTTWKYQLLIFTARSLLQEGELTGIDLEDGLCPARRPFRVHQQAIVQQTI